MVIWDISIILTTQEAKAERIPVEAWATEWDLKAKTQTNMPKGGTCL